MTINFILNTDLTVYISTFLIFRLCCSSDYQPCICICWISIFTLHTCARGKVIARVVVVVIVDTKTTKSGDLGTCQNEYYVKFAEKLASVCSESSGMGYKCHKPNRDGFFSIWLYSVHVGFEGQLPTLCVGSRAVPPVCTVAYWCLQCLPIVLLDVARVEGMLFIMISLYTFQWSHQRKVHII